MLTRRSCDALRAAALLAAACAVDSTLRFSVALPLLALSLVVASMGLPASAQTNLPVFSPSLWALLAGVFALGSTTTGTDGPLWYEIVRRGFAGVGVLAVAMVSSGHPVWRRRGVLTAVIGASLLAFITPVATPSPIIDVVPWTDAAVRAFVSGTHPYTVQAPDVYRGGADFGFDVQVYPYMPATILAFAPVVLALGDFRFALAACVPITLWLIRRTGLQNGADPQVVDAATLLVAFHPLLALVVRSGWGEPLLGVLAAVLALALVQQRRLLAAVAVFLLPTMKQYAIAPVMLWAAGAGRRTRMSAWAIAAFVAAMTVAPFLAWNASATVHGMLFQMRAPAHPRLNSMSIPGLLANVSTMNLPIWVSAVSQLIVAAGLAAAGVGSAISGLFLGSAAALLTTFLLGWQGFVNYYMWIGTLLVLAAVTEHPARRIA
jgi:hypothetical protein